jgi:hypothetical protein
MLISISLFCFFTSSEVWVTLWTVLVVISQAALMIRVAAEEVDSRQLDR